MGYGFELNFEHAKPDTQGEPLSVPFFSLCLTLEPNMADNRLFTVKTTIMATATVQIAAGKNVEENYLKEHGCDVEWLIKMGSIEEVVFQSVLVPTSVTEKPTILESSGAKATMVGLLDSAKEVPPTVEEPTAPTTPKKSTK